jgi:hypothetical protein
MLKAYTTYSKKITAENVPNLAQRWSSRNRRLSKHQTSNIRKETPKTHIIDTTLNTQNKERILKATKQRGQITY